MHLRHTGEWRERREMKEASEGASVALGCASRTWSAALPGCCALHDPLRVAHSRAHFLETDSVRSPL